MCDNGSLITGIRYSCLVCQNFNLCSECEARSEHSHALLKIKNPGQDGSQIVNEKVLQLPFKQLQNVQRSHLASSYEAAGVH